MALEFSVDSEEAFDVLAKGFRLSGCMMPSIFFVNLLAFFGY